MIDNEWMIIKCEYLQMIRKSLWLNFAEYEYINNAMMWLIFHWPSRNKNGI